MGTGLAIARTDDAERALLGHLFNELGTDRAKVDLFEVVQVADQVRISLQTGQRVVAVERPDGLQHDVVGANLQAFDRGRPIAGRAAGRNLDLHLATRARLHRFGIGLSGLKPDVAGVVDVRHFQNDGGLRPCGGSRKASQHGCSTDCFEQCTFVRLQHLESLLNGVNDFVAATMFLLLEPVCHPTPTRLKG